MLFAMRIHTHCLAEKTHTNRIFPSLHKERERFVRLLEDELDSPIDDIASGVAVDFRARLRNPS